MAGVVARHTTTLNWKIAGANAAAWTDDESDFGEREVSFLSRQTAEIAEGTTEMGRNVVAERVLGIPRERTLDRDVTFRDIPKGPPAR